jgi:hypothetical protein
MVQSQPGQIVRETLSRKTPSPKRAGGVAQGEGPEFKPQYQKKEKVFHMPLFWNFCHPQLNFIIASYLQIHS